jgi:CBS domain-containing protein
MKTARDLMNSRVIYFSPEDSIFEVVRVFSREKISGAPVVKNEKVVGVISNSDIVKFIHTKLAKKLGIQEMMSTSLLLLNIARLSKDYLTLKKDCDRISKTKVKDVMSKEVLIVSPDTVLIDIADIMERKDINRLPVVEKNKLIGMVCRADVIRALIE